MATQPRPPGPDQASVPIGSPRTSSTKSRKQQRKKRFTRPLLCLDYLKGDCSNRRAHCRFLHPDLTEFQGPDSSEYDSHLCEVWVLTGRCKFGTKCKKLHPVNLHEGIILDEEGAVPKQKTAQKKKRRKKVKAISQEPLDPTALPASPVDSDGTNTCFGTPLESLRQPTQNSASLQQDGSSHASQEASSTSCLTPMYSEATRHVIETSTSIPFSIHAALGSGTLEPNEDEVLHGILANLHL